MERKDFHKNANISGDLCSQPSCEDVGNLSEVYEGNNAKGIRNEDEFQELDVVADQNEPIEASQRKAEAEQVSTGEGKDSLNPDCQQNPRVATERQDQSEQAPDQKNVTDTKKSATTTVAKGRRSSSQVQKPRLAQNKSTSLKGVSKGASKNVVDAIGKQKNIRSPDSQMSPASNGSLPLSARRMSATSGTFYLTSKKQQGNALLNLSKSQKSATPTDAKDPCSSSQVQKPRLLPQKNNRSPDSQMSPASNGTLSLSANPVTAQSDCTVQQPFAPASTGLQTTTKKQQGNVHSTRSKSQKSATTTVAKGRRSCSQVQKAQNSFTPKVVPKVASRNGMDAIVKQDEIEEYEDTGSVTSSNSSAIGSEARPGSASSASDFSLKCDEQAEKRKQQGRSDRKFLWEQPNRQHGQQTRGPSAPFPPKVKANLRFNSGNQNYAVPTFGIPRPNVPTLGIRRPNVPTVGIPPPNAPPFGGFPPPNAPFSGGFPPLPR